jgi:hypothetical protein
MGSQKAPMAVLTWCLATHPISARKNWETSEVDDLLAKIRRAGVPLAEFAGIKPLYGIKTGLNEAFLIDTPTRNRLIREDPRCAEIIKPYLRGQDIKRWSPEWADCTQIQRRLLLVLE